MQLQLAMFDDNCRGAPAGPVAGFELRNSPFQLAHESVWRANLELDVDQPWRKTCFKKRLEIVSSFERTELRRNGALENGFKGGARILRCRGRSQDAANPPSLPRGNRAGEPLV